MPRDALHVVETGSAHSAAALVLTCISTKMNRSAGIAPGQERAQRAAGPVGHSHMGRRYKI
jgi:hypothetical protein